MRVVGACFRHASPLVLTVPLNAIRTKSIGLTLTTTLTITRAVTQHFPFRFHSGFSLSFTWSSSFSLDVIFARSHSFSSSYSFSFRVSPSPRFMMLMLHFLRVAMFQEDLPLQHIKSHAASALVVPDPRDDSADDRLLKPVKRFFNARVAMDQIGVSHG